MNEKNVENHYVKIGLADSIMEAFTDAFRSTRVLKLEELPPLDEFHIRGREATFEMIDQAQFTCDDHILDVGCGVGGASRWLAQLCGCRVTGLDITQAFCKLATLLTKHVGMQNQVQYQHGSALDMPFEAGSFDGVWMQHVNMNIADKSTLFRECHRVLRSGGKLAFYEVIAGASEPLQYPLPWAQQPDISFLVTEHKLKATLSAQRFNIQTWKDVTAAATKWFRQTKEQSRLAAQSILATRALNDSNVALMAKNMLSNLELGRIRVVSGIATV